MVGSRPFRIVQRPCLNVAVFGAAPHGLSIADGRTEEIPPVRLIEPGHPERDVHLGIETTTGPLGQGFANALGMALAERSLAATFNRPGHTVVDHHTYVFLGDGCMMEGISHEAYGWHALPPIDGHDSDSIAAALAAARAVTDRPSLICAKTVIGWGAPHKQGTPSMHGEPVGTEEIAAARERLGWTFPRFEIPAEIRAGWDMRDKGERSEREWRAKFAAYQAEFPALAAELERRITGDLPSGIDDAEQHHLRAPGRGLQAQRAAAVGHAPRGDGGGRTRTVAALRGPSGPDRRHRHFRRFGAGARIVQAFWVHARPCDAGDR